MGLKSLYYLDAAVTWILFILGIISMPFGIGGFLLTTPFEGANITYPWYHATGIWIGILYILTSLISPFAVVNHLYIKISLALIYVVVFLAGMAVGLQIDEVTAWFENPEVELIQRNEKETQTTSNEQEVVNRMTTFHYFHKIRIGIVLFTTLVGISLLLYRAVNFGLLVLEDLIWQKQRVLFEEEQMMFEAITDYQIQCMEMADPLEIKEPQTLLYATKKVKTTKSDLNTEGDTESNINMKDDGDKSQSSPIMFIRNLYENEQF